MSIEKKQLATVRSVFFDKEDHGILTCYIDLNFVRGGTQGFGGLVLNKDTGPDFVRHVCDLFGVTSLKDIIGKQCYGLYCFGEWNERIEGIENLSGRRFTLTQFMRRYDFNIQSPLERKQEDLKKNIIRAQERIKEDRQNLKGLKKTYTDWDKK